MEVGRLDLRALPLALAAARTCVCVPGELEELELFGMQIDALFELAARVLPEEPARCGLLRGAGGEAGPEELQ